MQITGHKLGSRHRPILDRTRLIAAPAARLVEQHMGGRVGRVDIAVTVRSGIPDLIIDAHRPLFGRQDRHAWTGMRCFGVTTISASGVLIVINAEKCRGPALDQTLLHELGHAVQFGRPGARDLIVRSLRNNYGIDAMTDAEADAANRQVARDEDEAEALERLARKLARVAA